jgi:CubicO group peptidase (beta-lactamase class C family)
MSDSFNHESDADHDRMSAVFRRRGTGWTVGWKPGDDPDYPFPRGSGGMISTASDYASFCQMFLDGGSYDGERVLSEAIVAAATRPQTGFIPAADGYGLGWQASSESRTYSHSGSDGTFAWVDPELRIIGLVFTQSTGGTNPRDEFRALVTAACTEKRIRP